MEPKQTRICDRRQVEDQSIASRRVFFEIGGTNSALHRQEGRTYRIFVSTSSHPHIKSNRNSSKMKFTAAALSVVVLASSTSNVASFTPAFAPQSKFGSSFVARTTLVRPSTSCTSQRSSSAVRSSLSMFTEPSGGMEQLHELTEKADSIMLSKQVRKSPSLFKIAGYASIPLSAALGFGLMPSRRFAAHAIGGLITGVGGAVGKSRLDALTEANAKPAIAQALIDAGVDDPAGAATAVQIVKETYGLLDEDFDGLCSDIYSIYLQGMLKFSPVAKTSELKELENIKTALALDNLQVGEAHAAAASEWYRNTALFTPNDELEDDSDHPDKLAMDKLLFLTERALRQGGETEEAFTFEMTRVAKALDLTYATAMERVAETVEPFYSRALKSTRSKLGTDKVSSAMLERARATLGVSDATARDMHVACFNAEVRAQLGLPEINAAADDDDEDDDAEEQLPVDMSSVKFSEDAEERVRACVLACLIGHRSSTISCVGAITGFSLVHHFMFFPDHHLLCSYSSFYSWVNSKRSWACPNRTSNTKSPWKRHRCIRPQQRLP
jgi:hypothetical protein